MAVEITNSAVQVFKRFENTVRLFFFLNTEAFHKGKNIAGFTSIHYF